MDISAHAFSLADRPQRAIRVTSVRMRREDRSSISTYPLADLGWKRFAVTSSLGSSYLAVPLFEPRAVPSSRPAERRSRRAQGGVKAGRRTWLAAGSGVARPRLDRAEHGARIKRVERRLHRRSSSARRRVL